MTKRIIGGVLAAIPTGLLFITLIALVFMGTITSTMMNPSFIRAELDKTEAYSLAGEWLDDNIEEFVPGLGETEVYQVFRDSLSDEWLAGQVGGVVDDVDRYLDRKSDTLEFSLSTAGFKENMKIVLHDTLHESPPEGLAGLSAERLDEYLQAAYDGIDQLPDEITLVVEDVAKLEPMRDAFNAVHGIPYILLMTSGLLAIFIILIHLFLLDSTPRGAGLFAGIFLLITGIASYVVKLVSTNIASGQIGTMEIPSPLTPELLTRVAKDSLAPAGTWAIIIGVVGLALIVASLFLFRWIQQSNLEPPSPGSVTWIPGS